MAYAAVISLKQTIQRLLNSTHISLVSSTREILEFAYDEANSIQEVIQTLDDNSSSNELTMEAAVHEYHLEQMFKTPDTPEHARFAYNQLVSLENVRKVLESRSSSSRSSSQKLDELDGQIREALHQLEDFFEFPVSDQFLSLPQTDDKNVVYIDLEEVRETIELLTEEMKQIGEEYIKEIDNSSSPYDGNDDDNDDDDDEGGDPSVSTDCDLKMGGNDEDHDGGGPLVSTDFDLKMVGFSDQYAGIKNDLVGPTRPDQFCVFSIIGVAGTGRTFIADDIFEDSNLFLKHCIDCGAWVTIGPVYELKEILLSIVAQIDPGIDELLKSDEDDEIVEYLHTTLMGRRYMIVLDDVWDTKVWYHLRRSFPEQDNGSLVLLTTCLKEVAIAANSLCTFEMTPLRDDTMWDYFHLEIFGAKPCPRQLYEAEKKIAENCRGLRFALAKAVLHLSKADRTPEYWNEVAANAEHPIFNIDREMSEMKYIREELQVTWPPSDDIQPLFYKIVHMLSFSETEAIKKQMFPERFFPNMKTISLIGMAGIGKTKLAKEILNDSSILSGFDHCVMVTLGPKYRLENLLVDVLIQIYPDAAKMLVKGDDELADTLSAKLSDKRCLIVLDDVWNQEALHCLKKLFPNVKGKVLVTTRLAKVAQVGDMDIVYEIPFLNKEESWELLRQKVFGDESCSLQLEKVGREIAENCGGLPLLILAVADILSKDKKTPEYWNMVVEKKTSVFTDAHNETLKVLLPSYEHLPQHLEPCFLYMGVFPQNSEIRRSKLVNLWDAEGFLEPNSSQTVEDFATECLMDLVNRNLVIVHKKGSNSKTKACSLHSVFWHLSNYEAVKNNFFHALNTCVDCSDESMAIHRRLCIRNSVLMAIKDVRDMVESVSSARSLLCSGTSHQFQVPLCFSLRLLRVLDALIIRFYVFPTEVLKLVHTRYLALTCNRELPTFISKLWNLEFLIVDSYTTIRHAKEDSSSLSKEIWQMKELKHLQVTGSTLPNPHEDDFLLNLSTLLDVSAHNLTRRVLQRMPNLKRLRNRIELTPDNSSDPFRCLNCLSYLDQLESLKCVVVNPELSSEVFIPPAPHSMFSASIKKLTLSGFGYPWEYMSIIGKLPNLEVLKLQCYAFRGSEWETNYSEFMKVKFLLIEDTDLVRWRNKLWSFINLEHLIIRHCYRLKDLPRDCYFNMVEIVDCNPFAMAWANDMKEWYMKSPTSSTTPQLHLLSSWDARD